MGLSDVVVLAGPNGVGKSRFIQWLLSFFRNLPSNPDQWLELEATCVEESEAWGKSLLDTRISGDANKLRAHLQKNRRRAGQVSNVLNFESNRSITQVQPYTFTSKLADPFEEMVGWDLGFHVLSSRFSATIHSLLAESRRREAIALSESSNLYEEVPRFKKRSKLMHCDSLTRYYPSSRRSFNCHRKRLADSEAAKQQRY